MKSKFKIEPFIILGQRLSAGLPREVVERACAENPWFTEADIDYALEVLVETLLDRSALEAWLSNYSVGSSVSDRDVLVVMAGNIPLAGFYDMLCTLVCGHRCFVKTSSKDTELLNYVVAILTEIDPSLPIFSADESARYDALIFSGGDAAAAVYRERYASLPAIVRTSRSSVAVVGESVAPCDFAGLADDVFRYFGLGCRNVSMIFVSRNFDLAALESLAAEQLLSHEGFRNNYRSVRALRFMEGADFCDCGGFILSEGTSASNYLAELVYRRYDSIEEVEAWLEQNEAKLQCVVSDMPVFDRVCGFGQAQRPRATDFADGIDVVDFLTAL